MRSSTLFLCLLTLFLTVPAIAAYHPPVDSVPLPDGASVRVNRRTVLVLRGRAPREAWSGSTPPAWRTALVAERLAQAVEAGLSPTAVEVRRPGGQLALFAGQTELLRPTRADARAAGTTPRRLAFRWAAALRQALALPPLTTSPRSLLIPFGETRTLRVGGVAAGPLSLEPRDPSVATADAAEDGRSVQVRAGQPGETVLAIAADGAMLGVRVVVMRYAGEAGAPVTVDCTGHPAPAALVWQLVMESYPQALRLEPGARARVAGRPQLPAGIPPGQEGSAQVPVLLTGPGLLPRRVTAQVQVRCRRLPQREVAALLYSNHPERILRPGSLYLGVLEPDAPCRLLYHHQNMAGSPVLLRVDLINPEDEPAEVQVIAGPARPTIDTVLAGQRAGALYLRNAVRDVGRIVPLAAHERLPLLLQRLPHGLTASGIYGLRLLRGRPLLVEVRADPPAALDPVPPPSSAGVPARHVYPHPRKVLAAQYTVGQNWAFVRVGKKAIPGKDERQVLDGNYGVLYDIAVRIDNPTPQARVVRLMLVPDAGGAGGVFLVEGRWIEAPHVSPPAEFQLAQFLLSPQEHRVVNIQTLPVGGSAYPVTLVVR